MAANVPRNTTYELIYHLSRGNIPQPEIPQVLSTVFDARDYKESIGNLTGQDLVMWVERLDQIMDSGAFAEDLMKRILRALRKTCGLRAALPRSHYFHGRLYKTTKYPVAGGGCADVWKVEDDRKRVYAAKAFRVIANGDEYKVKRYFKEVTLWKRLSHPNILPNYGAAPDIAELCVVSPWMPEGDLVQYLGKYPGASRVAIMIGVADGLSYLHSNDFIHGDLKGANILFDTTAVPQIADFGVSSVTFDPFTNNASTPYHALSIRWTAPEILEGRDAFARRPTKASDVYAFAIVVVEIFTGNLPYPELGDIQVQLEVGKGKRPRKPNNASGLGLSSAVWRLVEDCWNKKPQKRPDMQYVANRLRKS